MILSTDIVTSVIFSFGVVLFGYTFTLVLSPKNRGVPAHYVFLLSLAMGTLTIVFSGIVVGTITVWLVPFYRIFTALLTLAIVIFLVVFCRKKVRDTLPRLMVIRLNPQKIIALIVFSVYAFKILAVLSFRPILDGDALYFWIPQGKVFFLTSSIPVFDDFHFWIFTAEPGISLLYTWAYSLAGSVGNEVFRLIPAPFLFAYPILVYGLAFELFKHKETALISMILACFIPLTDFVTYLYAYYPDIFAATFSTVAILFTLRALNGKVKTRLWMIGVPFALSLLFKYPFGIITAVIILLLYFTNLFAKGKTSYVRLPLLAFFLLAIVLAGNSLHSYLVNPYSILAFVTSAMLILYTSRTKPRKPFSVRKIYKGFLGSLVFLLPPLLWGIRSLFLSGSLFGVPLIRSQSLLGIALQTEIFPVSLASTNFDAFSSVTFMLLPWNNVYFAAIYFVVICYLLFKKEARKGLFLLFTMYFLYLAILGHNMTGRHLLLTSYFLLPLVGFGLVKFAQKLGTWVMYSITAFYCLSSILQYVTYNLYLPTSTAMMTLTGNFAIPYQSIYNTSSFLTDFSLQIVTLQLVLAGSILLGVALSKVHSISITIRSRILIIGKFARFRRLSLVILFTIISISSVLPFLFYAIAITGGNPYRFDEEATWYAPDIAVATDIKKLANPTDVVLTVSDVMVSYYGSRVIDMQHGGLAQLMPIVDSRNLTHILPFLESMDIRFLLVPGPRHYAYNTYVRLLNRTGFIEATLNSYYARLVKNYYDNWVLYILESPEKIEILEVANFDMKSNLTYVRSNSMVNDSFVFDREIFYQGDASLGLTFNLSTAGSRAFSINLREPLRLENGDVLSFMVYGSSSGEDVAFMTYDSNGNWRRWWFLDDFVGWKRLNLSFDSYYDQSGNTPSCDFITNCRFYKNLQTPSNKTVSINIDDLVLMRQID